MENINPEKKSPADIVARYAQQRAELFGNPKPGWIKNINSLSSKSEALYKLFDSKLLSISMISKICGLNQQKITRYFKCRINLDKEEIEVISYLIDDLRKHLTKVAGGTYKFPYTAPIYLSLIDLLYRKEVIWYRVFDKLEDGELKAWKEYRRKDMRLPPQMVNGLRKLARSMLCKERKEAQRNSAIKAEGADKGGIPNRS